MSAVEFVCAVPECGRPAEQGVMCPHHQSIIDRAIPNQLEKKSRNKGIDTERLTTDEIAAIATQVELDAFPLFLVALQWCLAQRVRASVHPAVLRALVAKMTAA